VRSAAGKGDFERAAEIERNFDFITRGLAQPLDRFERLLQFRLRDKRAAMAGKGVDRSAIVRIDFDSANPAVQQKLRPLLGVAMLPHAR
jgi:hypothetical protein